MKTRILKAHTTNSFLGLPRNTVGTLTVKNGRKYR
jgi:hypothetical protein